MKFGGRDAALTWRTATSYDATRAIAYGLRNNPTREDLQAILRNSELTVAGANSEIQFLPSGDRQVETALVEVKVNSERGYYFELLESQ